MRSLLLLLPFLPAAISWGALGHRTVAYLASLYLTPKAALFTDVLLNGQDISTAALFADKIVHMPMFAYSAPWHYIDAQDDPHHGHCGINMTRDCLPEGCVVSAIANHTARVMDTTLAHWERGQALRFVIHFIGDVHQPLHTENEDRGGNEIAVLFDGKHTNLHSVWDTLIPNKHAGADNDTEAAMVWATKLYSKEPVLECVEDGAACALLWASEANDWVCDYVLKKDITDDLAGEYMQGAVPIIVGQVTKAGRRLAAWINMMAEHDVMYQEEL